MPKIKTHKATAKRFRLSGNGKLMHVPGGGLGGKVHMRRKKPASTKNWLDKTVPVETPGDIRRIKRLAPYLKKKKRS